MSSPRGGQEPAARRAARPRRGAACEAGVYYML